MDERVSNIIEALEELSTDNTVPRNVKAKLSLAVTTLREEEELSISVNKALQELDEISDDTNLQPHTRTQVWNIASILETI